jgi:YfiH family protein
MTVRGRLEPLVVDLGDGIVGCFTARYGGVSEPPWDELNLAGHVEDDGARVLANRALLAAYLGIDSVRFARQVHGSDVLVVDSGGAEPVAAADALVTNDTTVAVGVLVADCLPVLIADPVTGVVGAAHAGRRGLAGGVLQNTLARLVELGATLEDCVAVIGPGVCGRCYEVPAAMREDVAAVVPGSASRTRGGTPSLDLAAGAMGILRAAGVRRVASTGICTVEDPAYYSYRRDGQVTGRFAGVIMAVPRD